MQYTPIYEQKGQRITETYTVEGVAYHAQFVIQNQGFALGMAGYDPVAVDISLMKDDESAPYSFSVLFPKVRASDCPPQERFFTKDRSTPDSYRFKAKGEEILADAITRFHEEVRRYAIIERRPERYVARFNDCQAMHVR